MTEAPDDNAVDIDALLEQCRTGDTRAQITAMHVLEKLDAPHAVPVILPLLASTDEFVRKVAAGALGWLGEEHLDQIGPSLETLLDDPANMVRDVAAEALGLLRYAPARVALERVLLGDKDWIVRASAAEALGEIGDADALPALGAALDDEMYPVRSYTADAIGQLGDEAQLPVIQRRLETETHPGPRACLLVVALRFGDEAAFDDLLAVMQTVDEELADTVLRSIDDLLIMPVPASITARAAELDRGLAELAPRSGINAPYAEKLRERLAELVKAGGASE